MSIQEKHHEDSLVRGPLSTYGSGRGQASSDPGVEVCDAVSVEVAGNLRAMLGLASDEPVLEERVASLACPLPTVVRELDAGAWIAWCLAGLPLFAGRLPTLRRVKLSAGRVVVALAMLRTRGNLSRASAMLRTSRKVLRDNLRLVDLYPWHRPRVEAAIDRKAG